MAATLFGDDGGVRPRSTRSRLLSWCLVAGLLTAACGTDDSHGTTAGGGDEASSTTTTTVAGAGGAPVTTAPPAPPTSARRSGVAPTTTAARRTPGATTADDPTEPAPGSGDVVPTAADDGSQGPPGAFARTLLRPQPATSIVLERAAQPGAAVAQSAVDRSAGTVSEVTAKPVDVRPQGVVDSGDTDWTADEVRRAADAATRVGQGGGRAVLRLLVLRGRFEGSADVLGVAVRGDVVALFSDNIAGAATPLVGRQAIEDAVLVHELGHVLGLVDLARDTGRADKEHPGHSSNSASVMYWAVESSLVGQVLNGPPPRTFDAQDLADLRALREGA